MFAGIAYRLGYLVMVAWLVFVFYGLAQADDWGGDGRSAAALLMFAAGLIVFPVYFVLVYGLGRLLSLRGKGRSR
ncbi:hypothetical protein [Paenibacillus mucilaginosus]|uniref:Uncharacterized protein n=3 Tax=Paenibacillus mucilaginosus TaxID=61624 RepID=H6NEA1_9BACL|nr:hypothetical protein [Paenibacillus mucilaginosus]AFC33877.1 hypothetical protein PM3016_7301 [Paenibacillus mucilaginosus 3016]AFH66205.1 hypothetical protein B2K_36860 [Paenibacillus mucilaginosus K02]MCG7213612.1 hypothetical protein [Paenibacillus mucilaginosus]WDM27576.1 hypothetical protein KCX80_35440 [Paenibacillus mucilaginosus]WFA22255.1 hypothetical protein ERY13_36350 [Paenibacillus mucilaginosus]